MIGAIKGLFQRKAPEATGATLLINVYSTLLTIPKPEFAHVLHARRDRADPELAPHLHGFCGYVLARGDGQMSRDKYHVILHLQRVQQHVSLSIAESEWAALYAWAARANALLLTPDGHVRAPDGLVLVDAVDGAAAAGASLPYPEAALARKARSESKLSSLGMEVPPSLPPLICEKELALRSADELHGRAHALLACALRAESCLAGQPHPVATIMEKLPKAALWLSAQEQAFLALEAPTQQASVQFMWRYECAYVMAWALGLVESLPYPAQACDAGEAVQGLTGKGAGKLRDEGEMLDALDLHYRLHWYIRQQRIKQQVEVAGVDAGVVMERHHALNWLVRFQHAEWDDVDTPT